METAFLAHISAMAALIFALTSVILVQDLLYPETCLSAGNMILGLTIFPKTAPASGMMKAGMDTGRETALSVPGSNCICPHFIRECDFHA